MSRECIPRKVEFVGPRPLLPTSQTGKYIFFNLKFVVGPLVPPKERGYFFAVPLNVGTGY